MRDPIALPRNPSEETKRLNPLLYGTKKEIPARGKMPASFEAIGKGSPLEERFLEVWRALDPDGSLRPRREYRFSPTRKWKFDFAWPAQRVFVEMEGGIHGRSRHTVAGGFIRDCEKYNTATFLGWVGIRIPTGGVTEEIVTQIQDFIRLRSP